MPVDIDEFWKQRVDLESRGCDFQHYWASRKPELFAPRSLDTIRNRHDDVVREKREQYFQPYTNYPHKYMRLQGSKSLGNLPSYKAMAHTNMPFESASIALAEPLNLARTCPLRHPGTIQQKRGAGRAEREVRPTTRHFDPFPHPNPHEDVTPETTKHFAPAYFAPPCALVPDNFLSHGQGQTQIPLFRATSSWARMRPERAPRRLQPMRYTE